MKNYQIRFCVYYFTVFLAPPAARIIMFCFYSVPVIFFDLTHKFGPFSRGVHPKSKWQNKLSMQYFIIKCLCKVLSNVPGHHVPPEPLHYFLALIEVPGTSQPVWCFDGVVVEIRWLWRLQYIIHIIFITVKRFSVQMSSWKRPLLLICSDPSF